MPNKTANYNLTKPLESDYYDINVSNENMDIIDREIKKVADDSNKKIGDLDLKLQGIDTNDIYKKIKNTNEKIGEISNLSTNNKSNVVASINELNGSISDTLNKSLGDISKLQTKDKTNVVNSINELFHSANNSLMQVNNSKSDIAGVVGGITTSSTFQEVIDFIKLKNKGLATSLGNFSDASNLDTLNNIDVGLNRRRVELINQLNNKGVSASTSEDLGNLIPKISTIQTGGDVLLTKNDTLPINSQINAGDKVSKTFTVKGLSRQPLALTLYLSDFLIVLEGVETRISRACIFWIRGEQARGVSFTKDRGVSSIVRFSFFIEVDSYDSQGITFTLNLSVGGGQYNCYIPGNQTVSIKYTVL